MSFRLVIYRSRTYDHEREHYSENTPQLAAGTRRRGIPKGERRSARPFGRGRGFIPPVKRLSLSQSVLHNLPQYG